MAPEIFEQIVAEEFPNAVPERFRGFLQNVAFTVEDEPSEEVRRFHGLQEEDTLLGHYQGLPVPERGDLYGMGMVLPDCITLYQVPIEEEATYLCEEAGEDLGDPAVFERQVRKVVRETIWHEVAHHFGMDEEEVARREEKRDGQI